MKTPANPGPSWGYSVISILEKFLPRPVFNVLLDMGTFVGLLVMPAQRINSREYLKLILGHPPRLRDQYRHFRAFMTGLVLKLRAGRQKYPEFIFSPDAIPDAFIELCESPTQVLFGTFHVGYSDLMGCMLKQFDRRVSMVRLKVRNSRDTTVMESAFKEYVSFIWINEAEEFIFRLKEAIESGKSVGLQCDRTQFGSRLESFQFLGSRREFPFTIYHLSVLFRLPVVFSFTGPLSPDSTIEVTTSPVFIPSADRRESLELARIHFQEVLNKLESHLRKYPHLWFNFTPLNRKINDRTRYTDH